MSELPKGWALGSLNDLISIDGLFSDGDWIESKDQDPDGENRLLQLADIGDGTFIDKSSRFVNNDKFRLLNCTELLEGDLLIARMPDPLGRACLMPLMTQRCLTVVDVAVFRAGTPEISHSLLMHFINSPAVRKVIDLESSGTTRKRIARGKLSELKLPIPPVAEQTRIAQKLDELLTQVDTLKARIDAIPDLLKRFRQSVLAAAALGGISSTASARSLRLSDICLSISDGDHQAPPQSSSGIPFITISAINDGVIRLEKATRYVPTSYFQELKESRKPQTGDILFSVTGSICIPAMVLNEEAFTFQRHIAILRPNTKLALQKFLYLYLSSALIKKQGLEVATGTAQLTVPLKSLRNFDISLPSIEEQTEIVRRVEKLFAFADQLEDKVASAKSRIDHLTQSILAKAFRGELVPQDPDDEPASVLLERIKAQRAATPKPKRSRKASA